MSGERLFVRCVLTVICLVGSIAFFPLLIVLKVGEGAWLAFNTTADSLRQVWSAPGIPAFDRPKEQPRSHQE